MRLRRLGQVCYQILSKLNIRNGDTEKKKETYLSKTSGLVLCIPSDLRR